MLRHDQIDAYRRKGYLHLPGIYSPAQIHQMRHDLNWMVETWANHTSGWTAP